MQPSLPSFDPREWTDASAVSAARRDHLQRVHQVLQHIREHLAEPLDLAALGRIARLSPPHLNVIFRGIVGETLHQHVKRLRLERAATLLRLSHESVLKIALACGFDSHEGFSRAFSQAFRCSPKGFRTRRKQSTDLPAPTNLHYREDGIPWELTPLPHLGSTLNVQLIELPPQRLACLRHHGSYLNAYRVWPRLLWWAWRQGRLKSGTILYGLSYDDETITPEELQRYDAAIVVEEKFRGDGDITAHDIEGGLFARTTVIGSFADYWRTSDAFICQWLPDSGFSLRSFYSLDRYHPPSKLYDPFKLVADALNRLHVDLHIPVGPGPFGRTLLA